MDFELAIPIRDATEMEILDFFVEDEEPIFGAEHDEPCDY